MKKSALLNISLRYGAVGGILVVVLLIILYYAGRHPFLISPYLDFRILLFSIFIFFCLKEFRDYRQQGILYFWQALFGSFIIVFTASLIGGLGLWVFGKLEPGFVSSYIEQMSAYLKTFSLEDLDRVGMGKDVFERNLKALSATNIFSLVLTHFAQGMLIGFLISIILSVLLRKTN